MYNDNNNNNDIIAQMKKYVWHYFISAVALFRKSLNRNDHSSNLYTLLTT